MPDFPKLPIITPPTNAFPSLTIITPDPPRLTNREKYGSFFYAGIAGLVISLLLVGWFGFSLWTSRDYWAAVLVLNTPERTEAERIQAAWTISHHPIASDRHRVDFALRTDLPILARYILAEDLTVEAFRPDPKGYALMVARSEGWPDWLRLLMVRPMAYAASEGYQVAIDPLNELQESRDPCLAAWASYTRGVMPSGDPEASKVVADLASKPGPVQPLATILDSALKADEKARIEKLDEATLWLRRHHPEAAKLWSGWEERGGQIVPRSTGGN